jgi:dihydroceramidase
MYVMEVNLRPSLRAKYVSASRKSSDADKSKSQRLANDFRDGAILREMWLLVAMGLSIFLGGFGLWALDNKYCSTIRVWRHQLGLPWGILLEGHGWW